MINVHSQVVDGNTYFEEFLELPIHCLPLPLTTSINQWKKVKSINHFICSSFFLFLCLLLFCPFSKSSTANQQYDSFIIIIIIIIIFIIIIIIYSFIHLSFIIDPFIHLSFIIDPFIIDLAKKFIDKMD